MRTRELSGLGSDNRSLTVAARNKRVRAAGRHARRRASKSRGTALLAVLWLSAALSAIAFTVASTVRGETERTSTSIEALRAGYLAAGAVDRALLYIQWGPMFRNPDGTAKYFQNPMPVLRFEFPTGSAIVEIIPETAKLGVNTARLPELRNLLLALGADPVKAETIAAAIVDWRSPSPGGSFTDFDQHYLTLGPSFRARHASFQEIEELLLVQGMTPDLFYGSYTREEQAGLVRHTALRDCLSVYGSNGLLDVNTVEPAVLQAIGISPDVIAAIIARRRVGPIREGRELAPFLGGGPTAVRLGLAPSSMATLRATARLRLAGGELSEVRRSVSAMVKFLPPGADAAFHIMRWYDNVVSPQ
jgi:general secretion pathway protein K